MTTRERIFRSRLTSSSIEEIAAAAKLFKTHRRREHICELSGQHDWWRKLFSKINLSRLMVICLDNWIEPSSQAFFHIGARGWNCCWNFEEKKTLLDNVTETKESLKSATHSNSQFVVSNFPTVALVWLFLKHSIARARWNWSLSLTVEAWHASWSEWVRDESLSHNIVWWWSKSTAKKKAAKTRQPLSLSLFNLYKIFVTNIIYDS